MLSTKIRLISALCPLGIAIAFSGGAVPLYGQRLNAVGSIHASAGELKTASFRSQAATFSAVAHTGGRRTYWLEGGAVGGLALGALGYSLGSACPAHTGSCPNGPVGFLIGASVGFVIGAFIGDTVEKQ